MMIDETSEPDARARSRPALATRSWGFLAHAASTLALTGLAWFVQIVHYPLYTLVGTATFPAYEIDHIRLTNFLVGPLMLVEMATALAMVSRRPPTVPRAVAWLGLGLVVLIWSSTAFLQLPRHFVLTRGFDREVYAQLLATNWIRTLAWTARSGLVLSLLRK